MTLPSNGRDRCCLWAILGVGFPNMTVAQNIAFALEQQGKRGADLAQRLAAMIDLMELGARANARPAALSGGQKQRVALARALALEPQ